MLTQTRITRHILKGNPLKTTAIATTNLLLVWFMQSGVPLKMRMFLFHGLLILDDLGVSVNGGTPKSSILIGFSIINHPFWGTPNFWKPPSPEKTHQVPMFRTETMELWLSSWRSMETPVKNCDVGFHHKRWHLGPANVFSFMSFFFCLKGTCDIKMLTFCLPDMEWFKHDKHIKRWETNRRTTDDGRHPVPLDM